MTKREITDISASIKQKLLNIIRESGIDAHLIWTANEMRIGSDAESVEAAIDTERLLAPKGQG